MKVPPQIFHETLTRNKLVFHERNLITKLDCMDILFLSQSSKPLLTSCCKCPWQVSDAASVRAGFESQTLIHSEDD